MEKMVVVPIVDGIGKEIDRLVMKVSKTQDAFIFTTLRDYAWTEKRWNISKKDLMDALTKRFPKKPVFKDDTHCSCGSCGKRISLKYHPQFCMRCGQKVDWDYESYRETI